MKKLAAFCSAVLLSLSLTANASLIEYEYFGSGESGWTLEGYVQLDSGDAVAGSNLVSAFTEWAFTWTNGDLVGMSSSDSSGLRAGSFFTIDGMGLVDNVDLCTPACNQGNLIDFLIQSSGTFFVSVPFPTGQASGSGTWSVAQAVPAPATLALIGMSLIGFGLARRRA